jgi:surface polysaccharide O-acyltransferase-like enzyme
MQTTASPASHSLPIAAAVQPRVAARMFFIDNIRVFLTILVLLHHFMIIYAHSGSWYYNEGEPDFLTDALGNWFCSVNQAYFMGLFLLISAYFVPGSYDRKGAWRFFKDRLIRLGIPLALFSWVINPLFVYALFYREIGKPFFEFFPVEFFKTSSLIGGGPLWFVEVLLIFSLAYVFWRLFIPSRPMAASMETAFPGNGAIAAFALLLGVAGFLVRLVFPISYTFAPLNLQFPFFAQYIALFIVGLVAYRRNWLVNLPDETARRWLWISIVFILLWAPLMIAVGAIEDDIPLRGGWHWQAMAAALWESFLCVGMCISVVYIFRRYLNAGGKIAGFLAPNAYTAYIIHAPVITFLAVWTRSITLYPLLKWALFAPVAVALCFGLSALIRKIPYTDRVL